MILLHEEMNIQFPLRFCQTRWVENENVAEHAILLWEEFVNFIKQYKQLPPIKRPKNNTSYDAVVTANTDKLMKDCKFLKDVASILNLFLKLLTPAEKMLSEGFTVEEKMEICTCD